MKVSELISALALLQEAHGDLETAIWDFGCGCCGAEVDPEPRFYVTRKYDGFTIGSQLIRLN